MAFASCVTPGLCPSASLGGAWEALTVFGAVIGTAAPRQALEQVVNDGLASLAQRWFRSAAAGDLLTLEPVADGDLSEFRPPPD